MASSKSRTHYNSFTQIISFKFKDFHVHFMTLQSIGFKFFAKIMRESCLFCCSSCISFNPKYHLNLFILIYINFVFLLFCKHFVESLLGYPMLIGCKNRSFYYLFYIHIIWSCIFIMYFIFMYTFYYINITYLYVNFWFLVLLYISFFILFHFKFVL